MLERGRADAGYPYSGVDLDYKQAQSEQSIIDMKLLEELRASGLFTDEELVAAIHNGTLDQFPAILEDHDSHLDGVPQTDH